MLSGPSPPPVSLLLSSTEPRGSPDRHGPAHSSVNLHHHHYRYCCCHLQSGHQIAMVSSKASWVFIVNGSSSPLLSLSLFSSTEPRGPPDRHGPAHSSVSFIATVIIIAVFIYRAARDIRSQWSRPKPRGPSLPLFLSCTEPSRSPDRHGPVHSSFNLHRPVDLHRAPWAFTVIVIVVVIYRAAWATRSSRYHPKPS